MPTALLLLLLVAPDVARGPVEAREEWLLALPVLTLPAVPPDGLPPGRTELWLEIQGGNDFGWTTVGDAPFKADDLERPHFLVDGEHWTAVVGARRGLGRRLTAGIRLPVRWRGAGFLDSIIDPFHDLFGFPDAGRPLFDRDRLRVEGDLAGGGRLSWPGERGCGTGAIELELRRTIGDERTRGALLARGALPTGSGAFRATTAAAGLQVLAARRVAGPIDVYGGAGATAQNETTIEGIGYERLRAHGFAALEWRPGARWSLVAQVEAASRLVTTLRGHPGRHVYLRLGAKVDLGSAWRIEGSFVEGLDAFDATTDFGVRLAIRRLR